MSDEAPKMTRQAAIERIKALKDPTLNPNEDQVIDAYVAARASGLERVNSRQVHVFMRKQRLRIERGIGHRAEYWLVPKKNFPKQPPAILLANALSEERVNAMAAPDGATIDVASYWVVDQTCPRNVCGKGTTIVYSDASQRLSTRIDSGNDQGQATVQGVPCGGSNEQSQGTIDDLQRGSDKVLELGCDL